jgi:hypothetical protein
MISRGSRAGLKTKFQAYCAVRGCKGKPFFVLYDEVRGNLVTKKVCPRCYYMVMENRKTR